MENNYEDDYSTRLVSHPAVARANEHLPQPSGDFTRTIEKMQKAIQLHSISRKPAKRASTPKERAFRAREEFNPFLHNAWLTLAEAQFYNGDFLGAASTFLYITKHFTWLPETVTEARLWQARCYTALKWNYETENLLHLVKEKDLTDKRLKYLYDIVNADYLINTGNLKEAATFLEEAARASSGSQKNRLYFLLGQIYENIGEKGNAYMAFKKAGEGISTPYRTKFNARIKQTEVFSGSDISKEVRSLRSLLRYERNSDYLDQIYYAIGNLYLSRKDSAEAIRNYRLAVEKSTRQGLDMALANLALGNIYFSRKEYVEAQPCYASAVPLLPPDYPDYAALSKRSDVLDMLARYASDISLQDSLLRLSSLPEDKRLEIAQRLAEEYILEEKRAREEDQREEYLATSISQSSLPGQTVNIPNLPGGDKSWYFYNTNVRNNGKTEFQRKWGSRKLEDDWRRKNKHSFSFDEFADNSEETETGEEKGDSISRGSSPAKYDEGKASGPQYPEFYLSQIPATPEEIEGANDIIRDALYNSGLILKDQLEDYQAAKDEFLLLQDRYPDNIYSLDVYYNLYLMAARAGDAQEAEKWRQIILSRFPDSDYGVAMRNPDYFNNLRRMHEVQEKIYEEAYGAYLRDENDSVHMLTREMEKDYPLSPLMPKFVFIDALSYFTEGDNAKFQERLTELLQKWPDTDMTDVATNILRGIKAGRTLQTSDENTRGMIWNVRLSHSMDELLSEEGLPENFENDPDSEHYLVFAFPLETVNPNTVLYEVARFNFSTFLVKDFDLEQMSFSDIGLLVVKGFDNERQLEQYRTKLEQADLDLGPEVMPIMISRHNFELLLKEGRTFEDYFRYREEVSMSEVEATAL